MLSGILGAGSARRAAWKRAFPRPQRDPGCGYVAASPFAPALATAVCSVLWGMPQGSWVFSSGPWAPAHLPEPWWCLSGADIHPQEPRDRSAEQAVGPLLNWAGADPESPGLGTTIPCPTGHRPRNPHLQRTRRGVQHGQCPRRACCRRLGGEMKGSFRTGQILPLARAWSSPGMGGGRRWTGIIPGRETHGSERAVTCTEIGTADSSEDRAGQRDARRD